MTHVAHAALSAATKAFLAKPRKLLIGGEWVDAVSGKTFPVYDPGTGTQIATVAEADKADIDRAVAAARKAFEAKSWSGIKPDQRERLIHRLADLVEAHADELAELESLDNGKLVAHARHVDVVGAVDTLRYYAGWPSKLEGTVIPVSTPYAPGADFFAYSIRQPVGVVGQIIPWNFPLLMAAWKLGPALAAGTTIVLKPAEQTPLTALRLGELIVEAGFPPGVVNIVPGFGPTAGAALAGHPDVDKIAFTGSGEVGRLIVQAALGNLKKVTLELGGKSPALVFGDADLDVTIPGAANAIFFNQGQVCCAASRLYVHRSIFDKVVEGVAEVARGLTVGHGLDPASHLGPLVSEEQAGRVTSYIDHGLKHGATALVGGRRLERPGYFVEPTVLVGAGPDARIVKEEIFGPVLVAIPFDDAADAVAQANDSIYGLSASVWTKDLGTAHRVAAALKAGTVWINSHTAIDSALPFGGVKQSGWGRELGKGALDLYTELKSVSALLI